MNALRHLRQDAAEPAPWVDALISDPWESAGIEEGERRDSWLLNYIDILTLVLTLFVLLLALQPREQAEPAPESHMATAPAQTVPPAPAAPVAHKQTPPPADPAGAEATARPDATHGAAAFLPSPPAVMPPWLSPPTERTPLPPPWPQAAPPGPVLPPAAETGPAPVVAGVATPAPAGAEPASPTAEIMARIETAGLADRVEVSPLAQGARLEIRDNILFAPGSAELAPAGQLLLNGLARIFTTAAYSISVEGHTDDRPIRNGRFPSNWELSTGRASQVARYLIGQGISAERLQAVGYADTRPLSDNLSAQGRARNRRVSLVLEIPKETTDNETARWTAGR